MTARTTSAVPVPDDILVHAYLDGTLDEAGRAAFEARIEAEPALAAEVEALRRIGAGLRAYDGMLDAPIPAAMLRDLSQPRVPVVRWAAALGLLLVGVLAGWLAAVQVAPEPAARRALPAEAAFAHGVYIREKRHAVEVAAAEAPHLNRWLSNRLEHPIAAPELEPLGYRLVGGRLLSDAGHPAAHFMYENAAGTRFTLFVRSHEGSGPRSAPRYQALGSFGVVHWTDGPLAFAWTGPAGETDLMRLAEHTGSSR